MPTRVVSLFVNTEGTPFLAEGSPHAYGERRAWLRAALRTDIGPMRIEPAARVFRAIPADEPYPHPEVCAPYQDANGIGLTLRPRLPLLFVKTRRGELLPEGRTALAYARENAADFAGVLDAVGRYAGDVLDAQAARRYERRAPLLFRDIVQPYRIVGPGFFNTHAGFYAVTEPGIGTIVGPPLNRPAPLPVVAGLMETDWYHRGLNVTFGAPQFEGRSLLIPAGVELAQVYFVAYRHAAEVTLAHAADEPGGEPAHVAAWKELSAAMAAEGRGVTGPRTGIASVTVECLHCRVSVTDAAEGALPPGHELPELFVRSYKRLQREHRRADHERPGV